jgi:hypothetical protein
LDWSSLSEKETPSEQKKKHTENNQNKSEIYLQKESQLQRRKPGD